MIGRSPRVLFPTILMLTLLASLNTPVTPFAFQATAQDGGTEYPWPMFRHNPEHTAYTESPAPKTAVKTWEYETGTFVESSPAVADGMVFAVSKDGKVYALDQATGAKIWEYETGAMVSSSPAVADGMVFIGSADRNVYALGKPAPSPTSTPTPRSVSNSRRPRTPNHPRTRRQRAPGGSGRQDPEVFGGIR